MSGSVSDWPPLSDRVVCGVCGVGDGRERALRHVFALALTAIRSMLC